MVANDISKWIKERRGTTQDNNVTSAEYIHMYVRSMYDRSELVH